MKKVLTILLTLLLASLPNSVIAEESFVIDEPVVMAGKTLNTNESKIDSENIYFDYHWLTTDCPNVYNSKLASFAALLSIDAYSDGYVAISESGTIYDNQVYGTLQNDLGLNDYEYFNLSNFDIDRKDETRLGIAHKIIVIDDVKYNVFFATLAGTANEEQWCSNFDLGDVKEFDKHPDWVNINNHKGFDVAATRAKKAIDNYLEKYSDRNAVNSILITGHSRGGAISSILGTYYEDRDDINSYVYTFSAPNNTLVSEEKARSYKTIFNIANSEDFITNVPLTDWGYRRYGQDITIGEDVHNDFNSLASSYLGKEYDSPNVDYICNGFKSIANGRDDFFKWRSVNVPKIREKELLFNIENGKASEYWRKSETAKPKSGYVVYEYQTQFLLNAMGVIMYHRNEYTQSLQSLMDPFIIGTLDLVDLSKTQKTFLELVACILPDAIGGGLGIPHYCACSYAMTKVIIGESSKHEKYEILNYRKPTYLYAGYTGDKYCLDCHNLISKGKYIDRLPQTDLANAYIELQQHRVVYTGENIEPKVTVYCNNEIVDEKYYDVTYTNNVDVGVGKVSVSAKSEDIPFVGENTAYFIIEKQHDESIEEVETVQQEIIPEQQSNNKIILPIIISLISIIVIAIVVILIKKFITNKNS